MSSASIRKYFLSLILFSALAFFNSCSVHYFCPQRIDVYGFDTSKQTKGIIEPYFNMLNLHLAVAHSFTKHIYFGAGVQGDAKVLGFLFNDTASNYSSFSASAFGGYFKKTKGGNLIDISSGWAYERMYFERYKTPDWQYGYYSSYRARYNVPFVQFSYRLKGESSDTYFAIRASRILKYDTKNNFSGYYGILYRVYSPYALLISPSIQFSFKNAKAVPFFITANISTKHGEHGIGFAPPLQAGIKFMIH